MVKRIKRIDKTIGKTFFVVVAQIEQIIKEEQNRQNSACLLLHQLDVPYPRGQLYVVWLPLL